MTTFQLISILLAVLWLVLAVIIFRRSTIVLIGGLLVIGVFTLAALIAGWVTPGQLGLGRAGWLATLGYALAGLAVLLAWSPLADRLAAHWFPKPPTLEAFAPIRQSTLKLIAGILAAWLLGGILEELVARGIVLQSVRAVLAAWLPVPLVVGLAVLVAALGAGAMHLYQGPRAMLIIAQLSILLGLLFVASGYNLWAVMLCHGAYDTIAFVRFARGKSRYAK
jgi:membrane protease YdiL (CAAX protease family)